MASGLEEWRGTELEEGQCYSDLSASRISLSHQTAKRIKFDRVSFESVDMSGTKLTDGRLRGSASNPVIWPMRIGAARTFRASS